MGTLFSVVVATPETGQDVLKRSIAADNGGAITYPLVAHGRLHAGIVHGIAQMLYEQSV
ncbi:MAG: molybdopterin cofactor-binding domain-containing protein [Roseiflexaceae bacterium]